MVEALQQICQAVSCFIIRTIEVFARAYPQYFEYNSMKCRECSIITEILPADFGLPHGREELLKQSVDLIYYDIVLAIHFMKEGH